MQYFTIVGVGPKGGYKETRYTFEDGPKHVYESKFVQEAIINRYKDVIDEVIFFVTKESKEKYADELKQRFNKMLKVKFVDIEANISFEEFSSKLFEYMKDGEDVIIDITHGFRHIPMKLLFSLRYIELTKNMKIQHLFYGLLVDQNKTHIIGKYKGLIIDFIKEYELQNVSELLSQFDRTLLINPKDIEDVLENKDKTLIKFLEKLSDFNKVIERAEFNKSMKSIQDIMSFSEKITKNDNYSLIIPLINKIQNKFSDLQKCETIPLKKIELIKILIKHNRIQIGITFIDQFFRDELIRNTIDPNNYDFDLKTYFKENGFKYDKEKTNYNLSQYLKLKYRISWSSSEKLNSDYEYIYNNNKRNANKLSGRLRMTYEDKQYCRIAEKFYNEIRNNMNHGTSIKASIDLNDMINAMIACLMNMQNNLKRERKR